MTESGRPYVVTDDDDLSRGLAWIRHRLARRADPVPPAAVQAATGPAPMRRWQGAGPALEVLGGGSDVRGEESHQGPDPGRGGARVRALASLARRFGLDDFERDLLLLLVALELDPELREECARLHRDPDMRYASFAVALMTLPSPHWQVVSPERPLRAHRLVEVDRAPFDSLLTAPLHVDERIVNYLRGLDHLDGRLRPSVIPESTVEIDDLPDSQRAAADRVVAAWTGHLDSPYAQASVLPTPPLVHRPPAAELVGASAATAVLLAAAVAGTFGLRLYRLPAARLPGDDAQLDDLARLWRREAGLSPVALLLEDADDRPEAVAFARRCGCACFLQLTQPPVASPPRSVRVDALPPTTSERRAAWVANLPEEAPDDAGQLAAQFALDTASIARIAREGRDPWESCRREARPRLEGLAQRTAPVAAWEDLVLVEDQRNMLEAIAAQVRNRWRVYHEWSLGERAGGGLGIAVMFSGPSGTGKTLAAEVLAHDLHLDLYRADLSGVVSKYIGETEKNLRRLFDAAESGGGVLFIDEADALLGKRSEVRDSHDRFANIQIDYLLQRMESYTGLAILATNMRGAIDSAFLRRMRFIVEFDFPGPEQRKPIWQAHVPAGVPGRETLDFDALAELPLSGGMIRNVAVNAAFAAAAGDAPLSQQLLLDATKAEFVKLQMPVSQRLLSGRAVTP